jgi:type IV secretion system protein TrbC
MRFTIVTACRRLGATVFLSLVGMSAAYAQQLPWETPIQKIQESLAGPVAKAIGIICLAVSGAMLAFGGELNDFTKRILMVVLALSVMLAAGSFIAIIPGAT